LIRVNVWMDGCVNGYNFGWDRWMNSRAIVWTSWHFYFPTKAKKQKKKDKKVYTAATYWKQQSSTRRHAQIIVTRLLL
jgi:hypothetical protein